MQKVLDTLIEAATDIGLNILYSIVILIAGYKLIRIFIRIITNSKGYKSIEPGAQSFIRSILSIGLKALLFITVISVLGVPLTSVVTVLASIGLAIGLALQGALSNFTGGLMILIFKPFKVGDYIESQSVAGAVKEITVFYTILRTFDNKIVTLPNGSMTNASITNFSVEKTRRVDLAFSTAYNADIDAVKSALQEIAAQHPSVLKEPLPLARLKTHGDSALEFVMRVWCKTEDYWSVFFDLTESVKKRFDELGIEIPYPQLDVHINNT